MRRDNHGDFPVPCPGPWGLSLPRVDVSEDDDEILMTAELPGMDKDDFKVEIVGSRLTIRVSSGTSARRRTGITTTRGSPTSSFSRLLQLPAEVDADKAKQIQARVLTLRLPS
ncbi:Hsp20/alpha crystallin family protein [bacterium]|nr:Hsp20/alpha crystallin family protein [bacterium]